MKTTRALVLNKRILVKYLSKNIDGKHIDTDYETGRSGDDAAKRVVAWARLNRIRQFQFMGSPSVTVWRELRRLGKDAAPKAFADIYHAANRPDFSGFIKLMGGICAGKKTNTENLLQRTRRKPIW